MTTPLSTYWSPHHRRPTDYEYMQTLQPTVVKIMDGGKPDYDWVREHVPGALILARDWAISEQKTEMLLDPNGLAQKHAAFWRDKQAELGFDPARTLCLGINEPEVWNPGVIHALVIYTADFLKFLNRYGLRGGALQLSVGWPSNSGPGTTPDWGPYKGIESSILAYNGALVLHEYWADKGPNENWGWWGGRFTKCPFQVPIIIGECGIDMAVKHGGVAYENRGWKAVKSAPDYAADLEAYTELARGDKRFYGACVFELDFASSEWKSFDIEPCWREIIRACDNIPTNAWFATNTMPPVEPLPPSRDVGLPLRSGAYHITQRFYQNPEDYVQFGLPGHNGTDLGVPMRNDVLTIADGEVAWVDSDRDYGNYIRIWHPQLQCHSFYAHLNKPLVKQGDKVVAGQHIAESGNSGNSSGPHLHFEIRLGTTVRTYKTATPMAKGRVDPETWMAGHGIKF